MAGHSAWPTPWTASQNDPAPWTFSQNNPAPWTSSQNDPAPWTSSQNGPVPWTSSQNGPVPWTSSQNEPLPWTYFQNTPAPWTPSQNEPAPWISSQNDPAPWTSSQNDPAPWTFSLNDLSSGDMIDEDDRLDEEYYRIVRRTLEHTLAHFSELLPELRPPLPHFPLNKTTIEIIGVLGHYLEPYLDFGNPTRALTVLYCGAIAACRLAGVQLPPEIVERICDKPYCMLLQRFIFNQR